MFSKPFEHPDDRVNRLLNDTSLASQIIITWEGKQIYHESYGDVLYDNKDSLILTYIDASRRTMVTAVFPAGTPVTIITKKPQIKENSNE